MPNGLQHVAAISARAAVHAYARLSPYKRWIVAITAVLLVAATFLSTYRRHERGQPPAQGTARPKQKSTVVLAKIGGRAITNADLARYQLVRELLVGASSYQQALDELCDRALLEREALANGITVTELELSQEVLRRKALIAATATARIPLPTEAPLGAANRSASWVGRARPNPLSLFDRAELILSERGLSEGELGAEVSVDLLALKAKRRLDIDRTASSPAQEEDAPRLAAVWGDLRAKWGVELFTR